MFPSSLEWVDVANSALVIGQKCCLNLKSSEPPFSYDDAESAKRWTLMLMLSQNFIHALDYLLIHLSNLNIAICEDPT